MPDPAFLVELFKYGPTSGPYRGTLADARAYCETLARNHYENFSVLSWLLPRELRPHFATVYAYCRWSDDLADEAPADQRAMLLDWWESQVQRCWTSVALSEDPPSQNVSSQNPSVSTHPVFVALQASVREFSLPSQPFVDLLSAFRQDQNRNRYATINELEDYCRRSANPVGRIVLHLFRAFSPERAALSDLICTGLQWVNFCQDVANDFRERDRIYLPDEIWRPFGVVENDFVAASASSPLRQAIQSEVDRSEAMLRGGAPLVDQLPRALARNIDVIVSGGLAICDEIRKIDYDVLVQRPKISKSKQLCLLAASWWRSLSRPALIPMPEVQR